MAVFVPVQLRLYQPGSRCIAQQTREKTLPEDSSKLWISGSPTEETHCCLAFGIPTVEPKDHHEA